MCTSASCQQYLVKMLISVSSAAGFQLIYPGQSWWWRNVVLLYIHIMEFTMAVLKFRPPAAVLSETFKEQPFP